LDDFVEPSFKPQVSELWQAFLQRGEQEGTLRLVDSDGSPREVEYTAKQNVLPVRHLLILRQKTVQTETEEPAGADQGDIPAWVQDYALFLLSADGDVAAWYSGAERIYGYTGTEAIGQHVALLYPSEDTLRVRLREELKRSEAEGHFGSEGWCVRKDGSRFWANVITMALKRENGELQGFARVVRDFSERRKRDQMEAQRVAREHEAQAVAAQTEADRLKRENDAQRATAQTDLDRVAGERAQAEADKAQLRAQLLAQFNAILQTRDTARGLVVNMSDVLFDTAKYSLRPLAREKLARVAGILSGHPGLRMQVEGYTDSVGSDDYNQTLSEHRATSVRDYLTQAGIPTASVIAKGFGKTQPVASNDTSTGRQQNRRVELVVSGEIIGAEIRPSPVLAAK
jgi:PAS domain S-box-containing protein